MAISVFALGAVAVASIFPTAIFLQKQTIADVDLRQFGYNVEALAKGRSIRFSDAAGGFKDQYDANAAAAGAAATPAVPSIPQLEPLNIEPAEDLLDKWSIRDRTYPANYAPANARSVFAPMLYDADEDPAAASWVLYAFVLERQPGVVYPTPEPTDPLDPEWATADGSDFPSVRREQLSAVPDKDGVFINRFSLPLGKIDEYLLAPGVQFMDNNGVVYRIDRVAPDVLGLDRIIVEGFIPANPAVATHLWLGHPGIAPDAATRNPVRRILVFADADPELEPKAPATPTDHVVP